MEITECSIVSLETQNSQKASQDTKSLSKSALDVETLTAEKGQTASVNENNSENILKNIKVYKRVKKLQSANESDKQLKGTYKSQKCKSVNSPKLSQKQSKQRKGKNIKPVNLDKCNGNKSCSTGNDAEATKDVSEKCIPTQEKINKLPTEKKSPSEGNKQKLISQHSKKLLLSDYVTLSRDWTANRKTYTRNTIPVSVRAAGNYDSLTQKTGENNSECTTEPTDSVIKIDDKTLHVGQLLDKVVNDRTGNAEIDIPSEISIGDANTDICTEISAGIDIPTEVRSNNAEIDIKLAIRTDSTEIDIPTEISFQQITYNEADNASSGTRAVLSANKMNSLHESSALQRRIKSTILKHKNAKSKRKSVHFSDKIDMPIDSLNRNDIILETAKELAPKTQEESVDQLGVVSANDAMNASIEIDKIHCPIVEHTAYTKIVQNKNNVKDNIVACDEKTKQEAVKVSLVRRKRGRPRKVDIINECKNENSMLKTKVLSKNKIAKSPDGKLKSAIFTTVANLQQKERKSVLPSGSLCRRGRPRKIIGSKLSTTVKRHQRSCKRKANLHKENEIRIKRGRKQTSATTAETITPQQIIKRKRGRPRKCSIEDNCNFEVHNSVEKKIKLDNLSNEKSSQSLVRPATEIIANKENHQIITADILSRKDVAKQQQEKQKIDTLDVPDKPPKLSVSANCTDIREVEVLDKLPSSKGNENENEIKVQENSKNAHSIEICNSNASGTQVHENKEQNVQNLENNLPNTKINSEVNKEKKQGIQQTQDMDNLEDSEIACPVTSVVASNANKGKTYSVLEANVESSAKTSCSDLNLVTSKSKEQELQNVEMYSLEETSETITGSDTNTIENKAYQHKVYDKQQRLNYHNVKMSEVPLNVKTSENKHLEQRVYKMQSPKKCDLEALSELSNHDTNTFGNETKEQNKCRKNRKMANFKASGVIYDNACTNYETEVQKKYKRKRKRTVSVVRKLLKKTTSISKKMKRKKKPNTSTSGISQNFGAVEGEKQSFSCGVCKQVYNKHREINLHIMLCHNGLARINDDTPFSSEEELSAFNRTLKTVRQLQCLQPDCGKKFISVLGYKYHRESCGAPKVNCEICGKAFKEICLAKHIRLSHTAQLSSTDDQNVEEETTLEELPRRGAAVKALKKMENFIKTQKFCLEEEEENDDDIELDDDGDDDDDEAFTVSDSQDSDFSSDEYDDYFEKPEHFFLEMLDPWRENIKTPADVVEEISQQMIGLWEKTLAEKEKLKCGKKNCEKDFINIAEMKSHLEHCGAKKWICKLCRTTYSSGLSLYSHLKINHYLQDVVADAGVASKKSSYSHINNLLNTSFDHSGTSRLLTPYLPAMEWNMKFQKKHHKNELFSQWKPHSTNWIQMKKRNSSEYLPPLKESAYIKSVKEKSTWTRLGLFECPDWADKQRQKTFFVGGSVWGSAWCPTGMNSNAIQFLALAANSPAPHVLTDCSNRKGLIQLWEMGILDTNRLSSTPNLTLAIAHENGSIWDMEWCPSGCWEDASDVQTEKKLNGLLPRLGLLAVACSNSSVRIYSIPHPHSVVKTKDSLPIFRCRPAVVLVCPESAPNISCHRTLCTKISWQRTNGHSCLAAGFGNGMVCLWNLMSASPLLTISQFGGQLTLRPYLSFPAHGACIMGLLWVPVSGGQYLSTAGYDRCVKVWNLQDHNWPSLVTKRGLITDVAWLPYWCGAFASLDDCYNLHHTSTFYKECGYYSFAPKALSAHSGCTWSISLSDWLNTEASGDVSGEVIVTILCQLMKLVDSIKLMSHRRVPLFRISMETIKCLGEDEKQTDNEQQSGCETNDESVHLVRSNEKGENPLQPTNQKGLSTDLASCSMYEETVKKVGLVLHDNNMEDFSAIPENEFKRVRRPETMSCYAPDQYPLNSINKVSWNPNLGSHLWLFSAGQAGIARICCVYGLQSVKLKNTENKCKEKFKMAVDGL